ncbi:MAG: hypothetical protein ACR2RE_11065, partial [Geminicoccaceae bacterium]
SRLSSLRATDALRARDWPESRIAAISHAIEAHSFTGGIEPQTIEARILRDADRLDSTGVLGIARCFYVAGRIGSSLYDPIDPLALHRPVDDMAYALDHFGTRLLRASQEFHTATARRLAEQRLRCVADFHEHFLREVLDTPVISHFNGIDDFL